MKKLLILLLLCTAVLADQVLFVTVQTEGDQLTITDTELRSGFAPQVFSGGQYRFTQNGETVAQGFYAMPGELIMERFNTDGTIDGEIVRQDDEFTIVLPAGISADTIVLADEQGSTIATEELDFDSGTLDLEAIADEGDFFIRYEWLWLLFKWIVIIVVVIVIIRKLLKWRKSRAQKS